MQSVASKGANRPGPAVDVPKLSLHLRLSPGNHPGGVCRTFQRANVQGASLYSPCSKLPSMSEVHRVLLLLALAEGAEEHHVALHAA